MTYENFYIKAPIQLLDKPLSLETFKNENGSYKTINEYLADRNHSVKRFSTDGYFIKGFGFNIDGLDELRSKLPNYGLIEKENFWILSPVEVQEELQKEIWT